MPRPSRRKRVTVEDRETGRRTRDPACAPKPTRRSLLRSGTREASDGGLHARQPADLAGAGPCLAATSHLAPRIPAALPSDGWAPPCAPKTAAVRAGHDHGRVGSASPMCVRRCRAKPARAANGRLLHGAIARGESCASTLVNCAIIADGPSASSSGGRWTSARSGGAALSQHSREEPVFPTASLSCGTSRPPTPVDVRHRRPLPKHVFHWRQIGFFAAWRRGALPAPPRRARLSDGVVVLRDIPPNFTGSPMPSSATARPRPPATGGQSFRGPSIWMRLHRRIAISPPSHRAIACGASRASTLVVLCHHHLLLDLVFERQQVGSRAQPRGARYLRQGRK